MNDVAQMKDNLSYMKDFKPLDEKEMEAVWRVADILKNQDVIPCTSCEYCLNVCPMEIPIPKIFSNENDTKLYDKTMNEEYIEKARACIKCGKCEHTCPQKIGIRTHLERIASL